MFHFIASCFTKCFTSRLSSIIIELKMFHVEHLKQKVVKIMVMERSQHEALLSELVDGVDEARRMEILGELRNDYTTVTEEYQSLTEERDRLNKENESVRLANSQLWRQMGSELTEEDEEDPVEVSETITLEDVEKKLNI